MDTPLDKPAAIRKPVPYSCRRVAKLKSSGTSEQEAAAKKPTADLDSTWGKGFLAPDIFVGIVYRTV